VRRTTCVSWLAPLALGWIACERPSPPAPVSPVAPLALRFIEDDWTSALAEARQHRVPIFVEAWAPW